MIDYSSFADHAVTRRVAFRSDLTEAREAARTLRTFLADQGLDDARLFACELCLAEASNNAVEYVGDAGRDKPVIAEATCHPSHIELRVMDHTPGFDWPQQPAVPAPDRVRGRGLFIIQSLMDDVRYFRGDGENILVMRKIWTHEQHRPGSSNPTEVAEANRQLADCQQTISNMARELCFRSESLSAIFRCCTELGRTIDLEGFSQRLLGDLLHLTGAHWFVLRLMPPKSQQLVVFAASVPALRGRPLMLSAADSPMPSAEVTAALTRVEIPFDARRARPAAEPLCMAGATATGLVRPLLFGGMLVGTLTVGRHDAGPEFSKLQSEVIRTFAEFLAIQIANTRHHEEQVQNRLLEQEMEIGRSIQRELLPTMLPQFAGFELAGYWESARRVGGDFYDAVPLSDHSLLLVVADVMGKGVPAAMFAAITRSLVRALAKQSQQPAELLGRLNELLYAELSVVGMFITAQLVFVDLSHREIIASSAGHCPVLLMSDGPDPVRALHATGTPLGVLPKVAYSQQTVPFEQPGGLFLYTDGLTEAFNPDGEMFGQDRLMEWLRDHAHLPGGTNQLRDELAAELSGFRSDAPLRDDQAFLILAEAPVQAGFWPRQFTPAKRRSSRPAPMPLAL
jgi:serine phosphatase RsbU (regulator of sigma subunit)/anti-sigma regulatory factor (Ser/Thr protein kinase)